MSTLDYRELPAPRGLEECVACIWMLRAPRRTTRPVERVLPDGCLELVYNLGDRFEEIRGATTEPQRQPRELLVGPITRAMRIRPRGTVDLLGIRIRPGGAAALLRSPAGELRDTTADLADVEPGSWLRLGERLGGVPSPTGRAAIVQRALRNTAAPQHLDRRVVAACRRLETTRGRARISEIAHDSGAGIRTLERLFARDVGMSAKRLARLLRFQTVVRHPRAGAPGALVRVALGAGYFDQSHLVRDFREFAGVTPSRFFGIEDNRMSEAFLSAAASAIGEATGV